MLYEEQDLITPDQPEAEDLHYLLVADDSTPLQTQTLWWAARLVTGGLLLAAGALFFLASFFAPKSP